MWNLLELLGGIGEAYARTGADSKLVEFENIKTPEDARPQDLTFVTGSNRLIKIRETKAQAVVVPFSDEYDWGIFLLNTDKTIFKVLNPKLVVAKLLGIIHPQAKVAGVHSSALISLGADIHPFVSVGEFSIIGACTIGSHSIIGSHTVIKDNVTIGEHVRIRDHCVIGGSGFSYVKDNDGELLLFPHIGSVVIEDDVDIFPFTNVDRGGLGETRIKKGAKIDHFCHVSHNTIVGSNTQLTAGTVLCGGSSIGDDSWAGIGSMVRQKLKVGNGVTLGMGAVVVKDVPDGATVVGVPAKEIGK